MHDLHITVQGNERNRRRQLNSDNQGHTERSSASSGDGDGAALITNEVQPGQQPSMPSSGYPTDASSDIDLTANDVVANNQRMPELLHHIFTAGTLPGHVLSANTGHGLSFAPDTYHGRNNDNIRQWLVKSGTRPTPDMPTSIGVGHTIDGITGLVNHDMVSNRGSHARDGTRTPYMYPASTATSPISVIALSGGGDPGPAGVGRSRRNRRAGDLSQDLALTALERAQAAAVARTDDHVAFAGAVFHDVSAPPELDFEEGCVFVSKPDM